VHNIISAAAKTVPYKDMFDDTEWKVWVYLQTCDAM
jgi:hypothetical protein